MCIVAEESQLDARKYSLIAALYKCTTHAHLGLLHAHGFVGIGLVYTLDSAILLTRDVYGDVYGARSALR